jgi:hypothetical protein
MTGRLAVRAARERPRSFDAGATLPPEQSLTGVGENARVPAYTVNEDAVRHAKRLIDARRYVLRSRWQDAAARTGAERVPEDALLGGVRRLASRPN